MATTLAQFIADRFGHWWREAGPINAVAVHEVVDAAILKAESEPDDTEASKDVGVPARPLPRSLRLLYFGRSRIERRE